MRNKKERRKKSELRTGNFTPNDEVNTYVTQFAVQTERVFEAFECDGNVIRVSKNFQLKSSCGITKL